VYKWLKIYPNFLQKKCSPNLLVFSDISLTMTRCREHILPGGLNASGLFYSDRRVHDSAVDRRTRSWCISRPRTVDETAYSHSRRVMLLSSTSPSSDPLALYGEVATRLVLALIMSRIDYCNSVLAGLPQLTIAPLQRVQNAAACLVFELGTCEHVTASLLQLQWLPVRWRVQFKLCCLMHSIFHGRCPDYLSNIISL